MKIGEKIRIKRFADLPEYLQIQAYKGLAGREAEIVDSLYSEAEQGQLYRVRLTGAGTSPSTLLPEEAMEVVEEASYYHEIEYLDNLVLVRFFEEKNGEAKELARGHGHIIHDGALGIAQATSYAMRRAYDAMMEE